ncbi:unnamed protein product [Acanthosepion pharaonis]|uniref:Uncharacterized protein n=1 Tax=Acanthosepion pharaonis TaxID=158019 RepID=A0A812CFE8_ACAPH|nr:unnamed protein product [Sepia pharaonis]
MLKRYHISLYQNILFLFAYFLSFSHLDLYPFLSHSLLFFSSLENFSMPRHLPFSVPFFLHSIFLTLSLTSILSLFSLPFLLSHTQPLLTFKILFFIFFLLSFSIFNTFSLIFQYLPSLYYCCFYISCSMSSNITLICLCLSLPFVFSFHSTLSHLISSVFSFSSTLNNSHTLFSLSLNFHCSISALFSLPLPHSVCLTLFLVSSLFYLLCFLPSSSLFNMSYTFFKISIVLSPSLSFL